MSISGLIKVIKENELYNTFIFPFGDSIIFTNKQILVRDDPNLMAYFGNFLLNKLIRDGSACNLGVEGGRIKFLGERQSPDDDVAKGYLEADVTKFHLLDPGTKLEGKTHEIESYSLSFAEGKITSVVNRVYFDYLSSVGYDEIGTMVYPKLEVYPAYFIQDKTVKGVCMPLRA